jgi:hypothetical protein
MKWILTTLLLFIGIVVLHILNHQYDWVYEKRNKMQTSFGLYGEQKIYLNDTYRKVEQSFGDLTFSDDVFCYVTIEKLIYKNKKLSIGHHFNFDDDKYLMKRLQRHEISFSKEDTIEMMLFNLYVHKIDSLNYRQNEELKIWIRETAYSKYICISTKKYRLYE